MRNVVLTDNLTVYSALRAIGKEDKHSFCGWIPATLMSLKLATDLASLAVLVELLLFHDNVYVDGETILWDCSELSNIVKPLQVPNREALLRKAVRQAVNENPIMSSGLGHCPPPLQHLAIEGLPMEAVILTILGQYGGARDHDGVMVAEFEDLVDERAIRGVGFLLGAFYYDLAAARLQLPYVPHLTRSHVVAYEMARRAGAHADEIASKLVSLIRSAREERAIEVNEYFGYPIFDVRIPAIFGALLKDARHPKDVLEAALSLRESRRGRAVRKWISETLIALRSGDLSECEKRVRAMREIGGELLGENIAPTDHAVNVKFALGPICFEPLKGRFANLLLRKIDDPLRILRFLTDRIMSMKRLTDHITRVFGESVSQAVMAFPKVLEIDSWKPDRKKGEYDQGKDRGPLRIT